MRLLRNIIVLAPCGKPQASHFAHVTGLLQWLPGRLNFTNLERYGGRSARTHARWFACPFPFARLAVAALGAAHPRVSEGLGERLALDASFVAKSGDKTWGAGWFWSGMARAACWGLEVTLLAAVPRRCTEGADTGVLAADGGLHSLKCPAWTNRAPCHGRHSLVARDWRRLAE